MKVDPDDLLTLAEVAELIGLSNPRGMYVYLRRYPFPDPVIDRSGVRLWHRSDIERWHKDHIQRPARRRRD